VVPASVRGDDSPTWHAAVTGLKPEKEAEYRLLHNGVWPGVVDAIGSAGISRYDVFLIDVDEHLYLFSLFEFVGKDFARDLGAMAKSPVNRRWWKVTDACQQPLPTAAAREEIWEPMETVGALAE
jgi:L-rhamnose mutarotase